MVENRKILNTSDLDGFDKVYVKFCIILVWVMLTARELLVYQVGTGFEICCFISHVLIDIHVRSKFLVSLHVGSLSDALSRTIFFCIVISILPILGTIIQLPLKVGPFTADMSFGVVFVYTCPFTAEK